MWCRGNQGLWAECSSFALTTTVCEMVEYKHNVGLSAGRAQIVLTDMFAAWHGSLPFELADKVNASSRLRWKGGKSESQQYQLRVDYVQHGTDVECEQDPAKTTAHFQALCDHVETFNGVAAAICAVRTNCRHGRHACAAFKVIGKGAARRVLARNSYGGHNPFIEITRKNFAWWMNINPVILKVWDTRNKACPIPPETSWYKEIKCCCTGPEGAAAAAKQRAEVAAAAAKADAERAAKEKAAKEGKGGRDGGADGTGKGGGSPAPTKKPPRPASAHGGYGCVSG